MPRQNRVTPLGEIVAIPQRGLFIGNRGIIHDPATRRLTRRRWATKAWLVCLCDYKDIRREVMAGRSWTELFFLDEATALAAGHRPCFRCRREAAERFRTAWAEGKGIALPTAAALDSALHRERLTGRRTQRHALTMDVKDLPEGAMVLAGGQALLVSAGRFFLWTVEGYRGADRPSEIEGLITPPSTVAALASGYRPVLHPSAAADGGCEVSA